jgi:hypothetical protein
MTSTIPDKAISRRLTRSRLSAAHKQVIPVMKTESKFHARALFEAVLRGSKASARPLPISAHELLWDLH